MIDDLDTTQPVGRLRGRGPENISFLQSDFFVHLVVSQPEDLRSPLPNKMSLVASEIQNVNVLFIVFSIDYIFKMFRNSRDGCRHISPRAVFSFRFPRLGP